MKSTATIASNAGASHSIALTHDGAIIMRSFSISASSAAVNSEWVTNCPEGSTAAAPTSVGSASTNTVAPLSIVFFDRLNNSETLSLGSSA